MTEPMTFTALVLAGMWSWSPSASSMSYSLPLSRRRWASLMVMRPVAFSSLSASTNFCRASSSAFLAWISSVETEVDSCADPWARSSRRMRETMSSMPFCWSCCTCSRTKTAPLR
ncbi:MAG: hypothetical protein BWX88_05394 [Planctomycetes bacterium ADurb.Bin126]|nr:MAG: hypothetical protein BWX88_05394 [Planctomycetes bacterium ADurb.Bin126]